MRCEASTCRAAGRPPRWAVVLAVALLALAGAVVLIVVKADHSGRGPSASGAAGPNSGDYPAPDAVGAVLGAARRGGGTVVVDLGRHPDPIGGSHTRAAEFHYKKVVH